MKKAVAILAMWAVWAMVSMTAQGPTPTPVPPADEKQDEGLEKRIKQLESELAAAKKPQLSPQQQYAQDLTTFKQTFQAIPMTAFYEACKVERGEAVMIGITQGRGTLYCSFRVK